MLHEYGFQEAWTNQGVGDEKVFLKCLRERLIDSFHQGWVDRLHSRIDGRYSIYATLKSEVKLSAYLYEVKHIQAKSCISRLRMGVSQLNIHRNRYNPSHADFACPFCPEVIETEIHFVFCCPVYADLRDKFLDAKYTSRPSMFRLSVLLSSESKQVMINLGWFLLRAFERRSLLMLS